MLNLAETKKSGFRPPISIKDALNYIGNRNFLLPAIQREFVWKSYQIEALFDSIMRGYPINSFMFWHVFDQEVKRRFRFYDFLKNYKEFFQTKVEEEHPTSGTSNDFIAVIDGQQRLTSLYIGLMGTYAYKVPRKWWKNDDECLPPRKLYINLSGPLPDTHEDNLLYDFKFLTTSEVETHGQKADLFKVGDILNYSDEDALEELIDSREWHNKDFAKKCLRRLWRVIFTEELINFYQEENQNIDTVLDIFIRTNSGGQQLSFSNLLMSITTANWVSLDPRKEFQSLVKAIYEKNFIISSDFILKCCLVLFNDDIKFKVNNFDQSTVSKFETNWPRIRKCVETAFELLKNWGFNDSNLKAKNAVIPIIYYIYHNKLEDQILKVHKFEESRKNIRIWLCISLLKGVFGGQSDSVLTGIRKVLKSNIHPDKFPLSEIKEEFKSNPAKSLTMSDEVLEDILRTQKDSPSCYLILTLLYSDLHYDRSLYHKDHLHPASKFKNLKKEDFKDESQFEFYTDPDNWNSILNLQLLQGSENESKNDEDFAIWFSSKNLSRRELLIPENVSLDFNNFEDFIMERKKLLLSIIKGIVGE